MTIIISILIALFFTTIIWLTVGFILLVRMIKRSIIREQAQLLEHRSHDRPIKGENDNDN